MARWCNLYDQILQQSHAYWLTEITLHQCILVLGHRWIWLCAW